MKLSLLLGKTLTVMKRRQLNIVLARYSFLLIKVVRRKIAYDTKKQVNMHFVDFCHTGRKCLKTVFHSFMISFHGTYSFKKISSRVPDRTQRHKRHDVIVTHNVKIQDGGVDGRFCVNCSKRDK